MKIKIEDFSNQYFVRKLNKNDISKVYALCSKNHLYYHHCPPVVTEQSIVLDMNALPKGKNFDDKYYLGYFDSNKLIAVMDFIMSYPDEKTAFIGFFLIDTSVQGCGIGSRIVDDLCAYMKSIGISKIRLGWAKGNQQAEYFWHKNHFEKIGIECDANNHTIIVGCRIL